MLTITGCVVVGARGSETAEFAHAARRACTAGLWGGGALLLQHTCHWAGQGRVARGCDLKTPTSQAIRHPALGGAWAPRVGGSWRCVWYFGGTCPRTARRYLRPDEARRQSATSALGLEPTTFGWALTRCPGPSALLPAPVEWFRPALAVGDRVTARRAWGYVTGPAGPVTRDRGLQMDFSGGSFCGVHSRGRSWVCCTGVFKGVCNGVFQKTS